MKAYNTTGCNDCDSGCYLPSDAEITELTDKFRAKHLAAKAQETSGFNTGPGIRQYVMRTRSAKHGTMHVFEAM